MRYRVSTLRQQPRLRRHFQRLHAVGWPSFLRDDPVNALWPRLYSDFPDHQIALRDRAGKVVAIGNTIPIVVPGAFQPIAVNRKRDRVRYDEAGVWLLHRVGRGKASEGVVEAPSEIKPTAPSARR